MVLADFSGKYLNIETASENDICEIIGEGEITEKDFEGKKSDSLDIPVVNQSTGKLLTCTPKMAEGKKLVKEFGPETKNWVGKKFKVHIVRVKIYGQTKEVIEIEPMVVQTEKAAN